MPKLLHIFTVPMSLIFVRGQIQFMKNRGLEIEILSSPGDALDEFAKEENTRVHAVEMPRKITPIQDIKSLRQILKVIRKVDPDIIHANTPKAGLLGMIASSIFRTNNTLLSPFSKSTHSKNTHKRPFLIYHMRGLPAETATGIKRQLLLNTERLSCSLADVVICVSPSLKQRVLDLKLCTEHKLKVLARGSSNGVDALKKFNPNCQPKNTRSKCRQVHNIPNDAFVIAFVGRIVKDKGVEELIQAWKIIREQITHSYLLFVGDFETRDSISANTKQSILNDSRIILTGIRKDTSRYYAASDLVILPSHREGFPNVPLEAAAMGLPVIVARSTGCTDAVVDGETGFILPVGDVQAIAETIKEYVRNPSLRKKHGNTGQSRVHQYFLNEIIWNELFEIYTAFLNLGVEE